MLKFQPKPGTIVMCDFSTGFIVPEMVKKRPVVVVRKSKTNPKLVTIVPISQTEPEEITEVHIEIISPLDREKAWIKCDMITTVSIDRLDRFRVRRARTTTWETSDLEDHKFQLVNKSVANYLGIGDNVGVPERGLEDSVA